MGFTMEVSRAGDGSPRAPKFSLSSSSSFDTRTFYTSLAGVPGFEPGLSVLETDVLTVDTIPLRTLPLRHQPGNGDRQPEMSLGLLVIDVLTAATTELLELETFRGGLLVLRRHIVATLTLCALQYDVVSRHNSNLQPQISK